MEGLSDGRFAIYTKIHHSLIDGVSAQRLMIRTLSADPHDREIRVPWTLAPRRSPSRPSTAGSLVRSVAGTASAVAGLAATVT